MLFRVVKLKGVWVHLEDLSLLVWPTAGIALLVSQARRETTRNLFTAVYLWNDKITTFTLPDYFMYWLTRPSALHSLELSRCQLLFSDGSLQLVQEGWAKPCLGLYCPVAVISLRYYQPRSLGMPWHLSPCLWSPGSFPTSSIFLPVMIFAIFSPGCPLRSCLLVRDPYFWPSHLSRTLNSGFPF